MPEPDGAFDALVEEFYPVWFRYHPEIALRAGITGYERLLPAQEDDEFGALGNLLESLVVALEELDYASLDPARKLDFELMFGAALVEHHELLERDWRHRDPLRFLPIEEIFRLTLSPGEDFRAALVSLLGAAPAYLRRAQQQLLTLAELVAPELLTTALDEVKLGIDYLRHLATSAWIRHHCYGCAEISTLCDEAAAALHDYGVVLRDDIAPRARGRLGCGPEHFALLLRHRHFLPVDPGWLRPRLVAWLGEASEALDKACRELGLDAQPEGWREFLRRQHLFSGEARIQVYREECAYLRDFLRRRELVSVPPEPLKIVERPVCLRPSRCESGYWPDLQGSRGGVFFVAGDLEEPAGHGESRILIRNRCLRRGWGGAHLLTFAGGDHSARLPRRLSAAGGLRTGWEMVLSQQLLQEGFHGRRDGLVSLLRRRQHIELALLDLELHCFAMDGQTAMERLQACLLNPQFADLRLIELARRPTDAVAGVLGWQEIEGTQQALRKEGPEWGPGEFNDKLLEQGAVPVPLIIRHGFGASVWRAVEHRLVA
jgi:hypothetical protein